MKSPRNSRWVARICGAAMLAWPVAHAAEEGRPGDKLPTPLEEAMEELHANRIEAATKRLLEELKLNPADAKTLNLLGSCYISARDFDKAAETFTEALRLQPDNLRIRFNLAEAYFADHEWATAQANFQELIPSLDGNHALCSLCILKLHICRTKLADKAGEDPLPGKLMSNAKGTPLSNFMAAVSFFELGKADDARRQLELAALDFTPAELAPWNDTMKEAGYLRG